MKKLAILTIFVIWGIFTGSSLLPSFLHAPGPFLGTTSFTYTAEHEGVRILTGVTVQVNEIGDAAFLELDEDFLVQCIQLFRIQPFFQVTETDDIQARVCGQFQFRCGFHQARQVQRLVHVAGDHAAESVQAAAWWAKSSG